MINKIPPFSRIFASLVMKFIYLSKLSLLILILGFFATSVNANEDTDETLESSIESLKKEVLSLNRDLFILEEDLLFPANTQFSIFLSMNAGQLFTLDSVQLRIDDKNVANHLYTERELAALKRGGVQRLYIGNLASGEHEIVAVFTGIGPGGRDYRRGKTIVVDKTTEPQFVEFTIADDTPLSAVTNVEITIT
ncbi:MAG: AraC family transcriptional regulator [Gammaproteobacteria bacterium]